MLRIPQPWSKKRGKRRLGHSLSGIAGEAVFFASVFLSGVFTLSLVMIHRFGVDPAIDVAKETLSSEWGKLIFGVLAMAAVITGGGGLMLRLARLSASGKPPSPPLPTTRKETSLQDSAHELPYVPLGKSLTDSPGEHLAYRLAESNPAGGKLAGPMILALLWNSVWFVLLAVVVSGFWYGQPRWVLTILMVPFAAIGYWAFRFFLDQLRRYAGVGMTIVEISDHPLYPGEEYDLYVCQCGGLQLRRFKIDLCCEEETFFRQGTDVRVECAEAFSETLLKERDVVVDPQVPWEQQLRFSLPENVMHSFVGSHNAIRWKIVVSGESHPWPSFCRSFPVVVHTASTSPPRNPR
jgi:hypothetical protein